MRRVGDLVEEVRFTSNNPDKKGRFNNEALIRFFNSAQRFIQKEIFLSNPENDYFNKQAEVTLQDGVEVYLISTFAPDIWAKNSIAAVLRTREDGGRGLKPLRKLTYKERNMGYGYYVYNGHLGLIPTPRRVSVNTLLVSYRAAVPDLVNMDSVSELPTVCEDYMMLYVERKIAYVDSNLDLEKSQFLTDEERAQLREIFAEINQDVSYPPITDDSYVNY